MIPFEHRHRRELHREIHARPYARIRIPALVTTYALTNVGVNVEAELDCLRGLPNQAHLTLADLASNFLRIRIDDFMVKWERHGEFSRYSITQPLPEPLGWTAGNPSFDGLLSVSANWLASIPGETISATQIALTKAAFASDETMLAGAKHWLNAKDLVATRIGAGYALAFTDFRLRDDGFCRYLVVAEELTETRAGRIASRMVELDIYRMLALLALPVARGLSGLLKEAESRLADITNTMEAVDSSDSELLHLLISLAAKIEGATAAHSFRFAATNAYQTIVRARLEELREHRLVGVQNFSEFLNRRFLPAMATIEATRKRLHDLSERVERSSALIRTRADIVREEQNQRLLEKLNQGQRLQLRLQQTVEGLSIAAISYYALGLIGYGLKAAKAGDWPINPDVVTGLLVPLVVFATWRITRRVHKALRH